MSVNSLGATLRDFVLPLKNNLFAPFNLAWQDLKTPYSAVWQSATIENHQQLFKAVLRPLLATGLFFAHRFAWNKANQEFGNWGSAAVCATLYETGNWVDPKTNYMGTSAWLLFKGTSGLLKSEGSDRIAMLCLLILNARKFEEAKPSRLFDNFPTKNIVERVAKFLLWGHQKYLNRQGVKNL